MFSNDSRTRQNFVFRLLDVDMDGVLKAQDLMIASTQINSDSKFGQEIQHLLKHYSETHLMVRTKPKESDAIDFEKYNNLLYKLYISKQSSTQSCLV